MNHPFLNRLTSLTSLVLVQFQILVLLTISKCIWIIYKKNRKPSGQMSLWNQTFSFLRWKDLFFFNISIFGFENPTFFNIWLEPGWPWLLFPSWNWLLILLTWLEKVISYNKKYFSCDMKRFRRKEIIFIHKEYFLSQ